MRVVLAGCLIFCALSVSPSEPQLDVNYGDLHIHTKFSFDAFTLSTQTRPDHAHQASVVRSDPNFAPRAHAFYDAHVLRNLTFHRTFKAAERVGTTPRSGLNATLQERAWSSPIWNQNR